MDQDEQYDGRVLSATELEVLAKLRARYGRRLADSFNGQLLVAQLRYLFAWCAFVREHPADMPDVPAMLDGKFSIDQNHVAVIGPFRASQLIKLVRRASNDMIAVPALRAPAAVEFNETLSNPTCVKAAAEAGFVIQNERTNDKRLRFTISCPSSKPLTQSPSQP